jgi:hypothetical protein
VQRSEKTMVPDSCRPGICIRRRVLCLCLGLDLFADQACEYLPALYPCSQIGDRLDGRGGSCRREATPPFGPARGQVTAGAVRPRGRPLRTPERGGRPGTAARARPADGRRRRGRGRPVRIMAQVVVINPPNSSSVMQFGCMSARVCSHHDDFDGPAPGHNAPTTPQLSAQRSGTSRCTVTVLGVTG